MISYVIVGDTRRSRRAFNLANRLDASVALDNAGRWGPGVNHKRAWVLGNTTKCDWVCVLEDDAILCTDFLDKAEKMFKNAPSSVVSFYLGTSYPRQSVPIVQSMLDQADRTGDEWIQLPTMNHAVCIGIRQTLVDDMLVKIENSHRPIDEAIGHWAHTQNIPVSYPVTSLVDHADDGTIIKHPDNIKRRLPRKAYRFAG